MSKEVSFKNRDRFVQLGIAIAALRKMRGLSQEKLAEKLHVNTRNYQKLERGVHKPSAITIIPFLYLLSDQEIISFTRSFGQMVEKAHSQEVA